MLKIETSSICYGAAVRAVSILRYIKILTYHFCRMKNAYIMACYVTLHVGGKPSLIPRRCLQPHLQVI